MSSDRVRRLRHIDSETDRMTWSVAGIADWAETMQTVNWLAASGNYALAGRNSFPAGHLEAWSRRIRQ